MRAKDRQLGTIRLLIADDEDMFAALVEALVAQDDRIRVVGRARDGSEAVTLAGALAPDVVVMDIGMPLMDGIEATGRIREANPDTGVVVFTGSDEARDEQRAREAGAVAYVRKAHISALLLDAIRHAAEKGASRSTPARSTRRLEAAVAVPSPARP